MRAIYFFFGAVNVLVIAVALAHGGVQFVSNRRHKKRAKRR